MMQPPNQQTNVSSIPFAILGMPVSNFSLSEISKTCLERIQKNKQESRVSYLCTVDGTLITKCYSWLPSSIENLELLSILRNADISYLSNRCLRTLTSWLGSSLSAEYTPEELFSSLCQTFGEKEKGVFILGCNEKETKSAAVFLHEKFNKMRIVGIATPLVFTEGDDLINSSERDHLLIEQINSSNADVLIVNLEKRAQEIWLERVKHHLSVPLVILSDDTLQKVVKTSPTIFIPEWIKSLSLEKFYKSWKTVEIKKKFSLLNSLKLLSMAFPLIFYHTLNRYLYEWFPIKKNLIKRLDSRLFLSAHRSIAIIALPEFMDSSNFTLLKQRFDDAASHDVVVFDFRNVRHIQPEGFYLLIKAWLQRNKHNKEVYAFCPTTDIQYLMQLHRTWDLFKNTLCHSAEILMSRLRGQERATFFDTFTQGENLVTISLLGKLDNHVDYQNYMKKLLPIIGQKNCCIDFSYCTYIDNTGFAFLLNLRKYLLSQQHTLTLQSVSKQLRKQFRSSSVESYFTFGRCTNSHSR